MIKLEQLLIKHEGIRSKPYLDTEGKLTIGVGRNLYDVGLSNDECLYLLEHDIQTARLGLMHQYPWFNNLDEVRQAVMINMTFNMGIGGFSKFILTIEHIRKGEYTKAAEEMLRSAWANQVGGRAIELSNMMETGTWEVEQ